MTKTRLNKGERYWSITETFQTDETVEYNTIYNDRDWYSGNYFHTREEAEKIARKIKAVLDGAEVIEMPSEEEMEINSNSAEFNPFHTDSGEGTLSGYANGLHNGFSAGFNTCAEWFKSKIVK